MIVFLYKSYIVKELVLLRSVGLLRVVPKRPVSVFLKNAIKGSQRRSIFELADTLLQVPVSARQKKALIANYFFATELKEGVLPKNYFLNRFCDDILLFLIEGKEVPEKYRFSPSLDNTKEVNSLPGQFTLPSVFHQTDNQDRLEVKIGENCRSVILCDGVSCSGDGDATGTQAAIHMSKNLSAWYDSTVFKQALDRLKDEVTENTVTVFKDVIHAQVKDYSQSILFNSATTLELVFEFKVLSGQKFLVAMSYGDTETLVYSKERGVSLLNELHEDLSVQYGVNQPCQFSFEGLLAKESSCKPYVYTGGGVSEQDVSNPTIAFGELQTGDQVFVWSDGVGDAFGIPCTVDLNDIPEFLTRLQKLQERGSFRGEGDHFINSCTEGSQFNCKLLESVLDFAKKRGLNDTQVAQLIGSTSVKISPKCDDVTVYVWTVE